MKGSALALLALAGCSYGNPWDTSGDRQEYEAEEQRAIQYEFVHPVQPPQHEGAKFHDAELEGWRDTVLATADARTLEEMHKASQARITELEARRTDLLAQDPYNRKLALDDVQEQQRVEKLRLAMIEERQRGDFPRRND